MEQQDATAIANQLVDANLFNITGPVRVNYSASSFQGGPRVSYKDADLDLNFQDDAFTRTFTLVVPSIRLPRVQEVEFTTLGVETTDRSDAFVRPPVRPGSSRPTRPTSSAAPPSTSSSSKTGQAAGAETFVSATAATPPPPGRLTVFRTHVRNQHRTTRRCIAAARRLM